MNNEDFYTIKYSNAGVQQWAARYDGGDNDDPSSLTIDKQGNVYVAGYTTHVNTGFDNLVIKYNSSGVQQWKQEYRGSNQYAWDIWNGVAVDSLNNVYVAGYTTSSNSGSDYRVIKYAQNSLIATNKINTQGEVNNFIVLQNTPNPFKATTTISFKIENKTSELTAVKLWIEDANGNSLNILMDKKLNTGTYSVEWNAKNILPGIYYCRLLCNDILQTKKMVMAK